MKVGDSVIVKDRLWAVVDMRTKRIRKFFGRNTPMIFSTKGEAKGHKGMDSAVVRLHDVTYSVEEITKAV